jgi:glyoxylase-like metal-dependent hydrolase (beta-lactamase superfamily II)
MKGHINAFVIGDAAKGPVSLIDSGPPQTSREGIDHALRPVGVTLDDVHQVLHTHGHIDHIGGDTQLRENGDVALMIHRDDAVFLEDRPLSFDLAYTAGKRNAPEHRRRFLSEIGPNLSVDRYLEDGDSIDLGQDTKLQVVHLPGHTPGSVGYYWEKEGLLMGGDSLPGLGTRGGFLPIIQDLAAYIQSVERAKSMSLRTLVLGHRYRGLRLSPSLVRRGEEIDEYLDDAKDVAMRLSDAIIPFSGNSEEPRLLEVVEKVISALPSRMGFAPIKELSFPDWSFATIAFALGRLKGVGEQPGSPSL